MEYAEILKSSNPDKEIEFFWYTFKDSIKDFLNDNDQIEIDNLSDQLNKYQQEQKYKDSVLPKAVKKRLAIEAGASVSWYKYVGLDGAIIGLDSFGESAPEKEVFKYFGFTVENVINKVEAL